MKSPSPQRAASFAPVSLVLAFVLLVAALVAAACVKTNPPTDVGNPAAPTAATTTGENGDDGPEEHPKPSPTPSPSPTPTPTPAPTPSTQPLAYIQDMQPIFNSDCVPCHSGSRPSAGYSMSTYAGVMRDVTPGNPNSRLVVWTQPGGSMYRFWTGNASQRASMVKQWVVSYNAQQSR